jgi:hypothetical protein
MTRAKTKNANRRHLHHLVLIRATTIRRGDLRTSGLSVVRTIANVVLRMNAAIAPGMR